MKMSNNINAIRASGVLHNLHVKWQQSDSEDETPPAPPQVHDGHSDSSDDDSSDEGEGLAPGNRVANQNSPPNPHQPDCRLSLEQVKEMGKRHRDMIMDLMGGTHQSMDPAFGRSSRQDPSSSSSQ